MPKAYTRVIYNPRECEACGQPYTPIRHDQLFCSRACKVDEQNRELLRARAIYREVYHWRKSRGTGRMGKLLGCVSRKVDEFIAEDVREGRRPPPLPDRIRDEILAERVAERYAAVRSGRAYSDDAEV